MPLALIVSLFVLGVIVLTGLAGYLIDKSDASPQRAGPEHAGPEHTGPEDHGNLRERNPPREEPQ